MPARSCQCPERRAPITSRRWEVCSKPGDGTAVIRCKACGAIWTTRAKFAEALPYDIGPVTLPRDAFQHTRAIVALTMLGVDSSSLYIIKGAIILVAVSLDMRKYLVKK